MVWPNQLYKLKKTRTINKNMVWFKKYFQGDIFSKNNIEMVTYLPESI